MFSDNRLSHKNSDVAHRLDPPAYALFRNGVAKNVEKGTKLRLFVAYEILRRMPALKPGDYKMELTPEDGKAFHATNQKAKITDAIAFKVFVKPGFINQEQGNRIPENLIVISFRHKSGLSIVEKMRTLFGADACETAELYYENPAAVLEKACSAKKQDAMQPDAARVEACLAQQKSMADELFLEACGNSLAKSGELNAILTKIADITASVNELYENYKSQPNEPPLKLPTAAANNWPVEDEKMAGTISRLLSDRADFSEWVKRYVGEMKKSFGVERLEYTFRESLNELLTSLERALRETRDNNKISEEDKDKFSTGVMALSASLSSIAIMMDKADAKLDRLSSRLVYSAGDFQDICKIANMRKSMAMEFAECYKLADSFCPSLPVRRHVKSVLCDMAVNLCTVGAVGTSGSGKRNTEQDLWAEFNSKEINSFRHIFSREADNLKKLIAEEKKAKPLGTDKNKALESFYAGKKERIDAMRAEIKRLESMPGLIEKFIRDSSEEYAQVNELVRVAANKDYALQNNVRILESKLIGEINNLKEISAPIHEIFLDAYFEMRSHTEYKRSARMCADPYYYLSGQELAVSLYEHAATNEEKEKYSKLLDKCVKVNKAMLELADEYGLRDELSKFVASKSYTKENPFDLESNPLEINESGSYTQQKLTVKYRIGFDSSDCSSLLYATVGGNTLQIKLPATTSDELAQPMRLQDRQTDDSTEALKENLYGVRIDKLLEEFKGGNRPLADAYEDLSKAVLEIEKNRIVQGKLRNKLMDTGHFMSLLATRGELSGVVSNTLGELVPDSIANLVQSSKPMHSVLQDFYPDYEKDAAEATDFVFWKARMKIFQGIGRSIRYWLSRCVDEMAAPGNKDST